MARQTLEAPDGDTQLNPGERKYTDDMSNFERNYSENADDTNENENIQKAARDAEQSGATGGADPKKSVKDQESSPEWENKTSPGGGKKASIKMPGNTNKKKWFIGGGIGAGLVAIPFLLVAVMPLKLEMYIKNITKVPASVATYGVEERTEYLVTRALATRLIMAANKGNVDGKLIFCKTGGVACSLFTTYTNDYFEKKLGITIAVDANGRASLGGRASSWDVSLGKQDGLDVQGPMKRISSNGEMKALIKKEVLEKGKYNSIISRFLARKLLMKKFGVTSWRGPPKVEKLANSYDTAKTNVKTSLIKNTTGKISPRLATYLTCLQGETSVCTNLRQQLSSSITIPNNPDDDPNLDKNSDEYKTLKKKYDQMVAAKEKISGVKVTEADASGPVKKIITKRIITAVGGVTAIAGTLDLIFSAVGTIDNGALEEIWYDMAAQTYTGFSTDIITLNEKMKAGDLDADTIAAAFALFDNAENSPLQQAENGLSVDTSSGITTDCNGVDGTKVATQLKAGELVCPDQKVVRDYTSSFTDNPAWASFAAAAAVWNSTAGAIIDFAGDAVGAVLNSLPGFKELMAFAGDAIEPMIDWMVGLIFEPPATGYEEAGSDNYTALSAGIRTEQNALMEEGVDTDGTAMGGGGTVLSTKDTAMIVNESNNIDNEYFNSQPLLARIFNTDLRGSFAQRFIASIPTSVSALANVPVTSLSQLSASTQAGAATTSSVINPFGLPLYGYAVGDPVLTAEPSTYDTAYCAASSAARLASFKKQEGGLVATYSVADPCALEKMVVGAALYDAGVTDDKYSLQYPTFNSGASVVAATPASGKIVLPVDPGYRAPDANQDFGSRSCAGCSTWHKGVDLTNYPGGTLGKPVYAIGDGEVVSSGIGGAGSSTSMCAGGGTGFNNTVGIKLTSGVIVQYLHMGGKDITVRVGDKVTAGQQIGKINNCGQSYGTHLHFEIRLASTTDPLILALEKDPGGSYVNPVKFMALYGVSL